MDDVSKNDGFDDDKEKSQTNNDKDDGNNENTGSFYSPKTILLIILKLIVLLMLLYLFTVSLDLLSSAFRLVGGSSVGRILQSNKVLQNPIAGLMVGVLITVLLQSSSTTTSIIVTMVGADIISIRQSAFLIMGANIGTSVTNTIVSISHIGDNKAFEQCFAGATVHDVFNWLVVLILLPLEAATRMLQKLVEAISNSWSLDKNESLKIDFLKVLTKPLTDLIVQLDSKIVNDPNKLYNATTILKVCCKQETATSKNTECLQRCEHFANILNGSSWSDTAIGILMLVVSITLLSTCLIGLVKTLKSLLDAQIKAMIRKFGEASITKWWIGYLAIFAGAALTILVQSSSVFTSVCTPLVGTGVLTLEMMLPLTLGANIGTTITGILAAVAVARSVALQTALIHLLFNIIGIIIWYPVPLLRSVPLAAARRLGRTTGKYRWFAIAYLLMAFFIGPLLFFGLSLLHWAASVAAAGVILLVLLFVIVVNQLQRKMPHVLPQTMRSWDWMPLWMRSLQPLDDLFTKMACRCCKRNQVADVEKGIDDKVESKDEGVDENDSEDVKTEF